MSISPNRIPTKSCCNTWPTPLPGASKDARPPANHTRVIAMSTKTRVLNVRVVGFSAPERQMLNSIFLLSVAPARQIGYKLWNPEAGVAPDMYLLDGDSESAVASWQATFSSTSDRTLVVGAKNTDVGVAAASRPLGLKVVGAMDRLAISLSTVREPAGHDVSEPRAAGTMPTSASATGPSGQSSRTS